MTSKISSFKIALEDLRERSWMLALSMLGSFLALPVSFLLWNRSYHRDFNSLIMNYNEYLNEWATVSEGCILIVGALIVGIWGARYLYSRRKSDLFHGLPVKRGRLFFISWLNGLLIWLIPMIFCILLTLLFMLFNLASWPDGLSYAGTLCLGIFRAIGIYLIAFLTIYHFCLVCVALSGNALNALYSTLLLGLAAISIYGLIVGMHEIFFDTFVAPIISSWQVLWASPVANAVMILVRSATDHYIIGYQEANALPFSPLYIVMTFVTLAVNFVLAYRLFLSRPSELAERGIKQPVVQHAMRLAAGFAGGVCGALFFSLVIDDYYAIGWQIFGGILGGGFCFGVTDIIMSRSFRSFLSHKWEMGSCIVFSCLFLMSFTFDWTGFNSRLPSRNSIQNATVSFYRYTDSSSPYTLDENGMLIDQNSKDYLPEIGYTDQENIYALLQRLTERTRSTVRSHSLYGDIPSENGLTTTMTIQVKLTGGRSFLRRYPVTDQDFDLLWPILESDGYRECFYKVSSGLLGMPDKIYVRSEFAYDEYQVMGEAQIQALAAAYFQDFLEHYNSEDLEHGVYPAYLEFRYGSSRDRYFTLRFYENYTNTLREIRSIFPDFSFSLEEMVQKEVLESLTLDIFFQNTPDYVGIPFTEETLGSYLKLEGYPRFDDLVEKLSLQQSEEFEKQDADLSGETEPGEEAAEITTSSPAAMSQSTQPDEKATYEPAYTVTPELILELTEKEDFLKIAPYLYAGDLDSSFFTPDEEEYIYLGVGKVRNGKTFELYVKPGEFPKEWIDRMLQDGVRNTDEPGASGYIQ